MDLPTGMTFIGIVHLIMNRLPTPEGGIPSLFPDFGTQVSNVHPKEKNLPTQLNHLLLLTYFFSL